MYNNRLNTILNYADYLWKLILISFYTLKGDKYSIANLHNKKNRTYQKHNYFCRFCSVFNCVCVLFIFFIIHLIRSFSISTYPEILQTYDVHRLKYLSENESMTYNIYRNKINYIYIDIGCFNGETIEHFIHFTPQSILYDIITFEPDPINYQLCKQKLSQAKYRDYNIFIIPKVVWIYNGKISYQINRGQKSGIYNNKTEDTQSVVELDAIDFSSWLSNLVTLNNTKVHIRLTMPGFETRFLRKLVVDNTLLLANRWDVDWSSRSDPSVYPEHVYLHLMFDSFGFTCIGFTHLRNIRKIFKMKQPYANVTMYYNLSQLPQTDTYSHYVQRPDIGESPRTLKPAVKLKTI